MNTLVILNKDLNYLVLLVTLTQNLPFHGHHWKKLRSINFSRLYLAFLTQPFVL